MTTTTKNDVISRKIDELIDQGRDQAGALLARLQSDQIEDAIVPIGPGANGWASGRANTMGAQAMGAQGSEQGGCGNHFPGPCLLLFDDSQ